MQCAQCTEILNVYDKEYDITGDMFGNGCCAINVMHAMIKMHFNQSKRDPGIFEAIQIEHTACTNCPLNCVSGRHMPQCVGRAC